MSAFDSHMRQNAYSYRNLKQTFEDLLPCYCHTLKTNSGKIPIRGSQSTFVGKGAVTSSSLHDTSTLNLARVQLVGW